MKKPSRQIREEIARLQDQLRQTEAREAERIGRIALKAGIGEIELEETALLAAFEDVAGRFRKGGNRTTKAAQTVAAGASSGAAEQG
jgi:hypothetical protein